MYKRKFKEINFKDRNGNIVATLKNKRFTDVSLTNPRCALELYMPCVYKKIKTLGEAAINDPLIFDDIAMKLKKYDNKESYLNFQFTFKGQDEITELIDIVKISCVMGMVTIVNADDPNYYIYNVHFKEIEIIDFTEKDQEEEDKYQKMKNYGR